MAKVILVLLILSGCVTREGDMQPDQTLWLVKHAPWHHMP